MTIPNRKTVREALAASILAQQTTLQRVYDYQPKDLAGESPVCSVISDPVKYNLVTDAEYQSFGLMVTYFARYDGETGSGMDAPAAEDALDNLAQGLATLIFKDYNARFTRPSEMVDAMIDGVAYAIESHYVEVDW